MAEAFAARMWDSITIQLISRWWKRMKFKLSGMADVLVGTAEGTKKTSSGTKSRKSVKGAPVYQGEPC
jgi:hypothetical protein